MQILRIVHLRLDALVHPGCSRVALVLVRRAPWIFSGACLHRAGLAALAAGSFTQAEGLFERAALRYREELRIEPLARVRVHQLMARALADDSPHHARDLEVERALARLDWIERPAPPFDPVPAHALLASWPADPDFGEGAVRRTHTEPERLSA